MFTPAVKATALSRYIVRSSPWNICSMGWNACSKGWDGKLRGNKRCRLPVKAISECGARLFLR